MSQHNPSAEFVKLLLNSTSEGIWSIGLDGLITYVNATAVKMFGYDDMSQMIGQHSHELVHHSYPDGRHYPRVDCPIYKAFQEGAAIHLADEVLWRRDGSSFYADYSSVPMKEDGKIIGAVVTFKDNTEKRRIQDELLLQQAWLKATLKGIGDAVITTDAANLPRITFLNPVAERLTGWSLQEALGKPVLEVFHIVHQETRKPANNPIDRVLKEGVVVGLANSTILISKDKSEYIIEDSAAPIEKADGTIQGVVLVFRDATEQHRLLQKNDEANRQTEVERAKLQKIFNQAPVPLAMFETSRHRVVFANAPFNEMFFGGKAETGKTMSEGMPEAGGQGLIELLDNVYRTGQRHVGTETAITVTQKDGGKKRLFLNFTFEPTRNVHGEINGILVVALDVTEQIEARNKLQESETYFRQLVDASPAMVWITDVQSNCTYLSRQWYEFTGRTAEQDLGLGWLENIHPDDLAHTGEVYANAVANKGPLNVDYRLRRKDGDYRWSVDIGYPRFDAAGNFIGYIGTVTDIHDRLRAEYELKETQRRFERCAEATELGVWYCDLPFDELIWNREVKQHFFLPPDARVTIDTFYERIHPHDRQMVKDAIQFSNDNRTPYDLVYRTTNPVAPTEIKSIRAVGWTDYDSNGVPIRFDGITLDVTNLLRSQAELRLAKDAAEAASTAKTAFLANMSHEIRTPLGAILGFSDLMKDQTLSYQERDQFLETISRNGKALTRIIDDILDLAKVESGKLETESVEFSLNELLEEVVDLFRERAKSKGISLGFDFNDPSVDHICSDPTRLRQILINIIGNAVKFTHAGGVEISVETSADGPCRLSVKIAVKDTGVGITDEQKKRLFQPFSQADNTTTRKFGGTGLGLALSYRLAKALGGTIEISDCEAGKGCVFIVRFVATLPKGSGAFRSGQASPTAGAGEKRLRLSGTNILVADDSPDNQFLVQHILSQNGARVGIAGNGREAVSMARQADYDLILMDIQMPEMDGNEATRALRSSGFKKPIIALTAHAMSEERALTRAAGCDGHLTKPLDQKTLLETIEAHLSARKRVH